MDCGPEAISSLDAAVVSWGAETGMKQEMSFLISDTQTSLAAKLSMTQNLYLRKVWLERTGQLRGQGGL